MAFSASRSDSKVYSNRLKIPNAKQRSSHKNSSEDHNRTCPQKYINPNCKDGLCRTEGFNISSMENGSCMELRNSLPSEASSTDDGVGFLDCWKKANIIDKVPISDEDCADGLFSSVSQESAGRTSNGLSTGWATRRITPKVVVSDFSGHSEGDGATDQHPHDSGSGSEGSEHCGSNSEQFGDFQYRVKYGERSVGRADRRLSCLSLSTVSSVCGEDRSRRGSLLDLEAEGLIMSGDGRLQRTSSLPDFLPPLATDSSARLLQNVNSCQHQRLDRASTVGCELKPHQSRRIRRGFRCLLCVSGREEHTGEDDVGICNGDEDKYSLCSESNQFFANSQHNNHVLDSESLKKISQWRKVKGVVQWSPFVQTYRRQKYPWIQLAGHTGNFRSGVNGTILKKLCGRERECLQEIKHDILAQHVPQLICTELDEEGKEFLCMQDLLSEFEDPCVMDCKMGVRTYMEEELAKAREKPKLRKDMYEKMIAVDKKAPTEEEHRLRAVTKPRYMVWRETISSTSTLGFRIEALRRSDGFSSKDFKTTRTMDQVVSAISMFVADLDDIAMKYLDCLERIRENLLKSEFFRNHELIGSSLLFVHDASGRAGVWMIDFAKTVPLPAHVHCISHRSVWSPGNHEDGYLTGVDSLIEVFQRFVAPSI